jgi:trimeric autotransporter adhesin
MHLLIEFRKPIALSIIMLLLACIAFPQTVRAVIPPPDGGYGPPAYGTGNTAEGEDALLNLTSGGHFNTATGYRALLSNTVGDFNTAIGAGALSNNTASQNTATGAGALLNNTTGALNTAVGESALFSNTAGGINTGVGQGALQLNTTGVQNTANGVSALGSNTIGGFNTASGVNALTSNTSGDSNTANGVNALRTNTTGDNNTALGLSALFSNDSGNSNTGIGRSALYNNTTGIENTATGEQALSNSTTGDRNVAVGADALLNNTIGSFNVAAGFNALGDNNAGRSNVGVGPQALSSNVAGNNNTAVGALAGINSTGDFNVYVGAGITGVAGENNITRIRNIYSSVASGRAVYVDSDNKIGTLSSSRRYKEEIKPMDKASETLFALKPVTFRYKKNVDSERELSFGLIAEEVAEISPDLITRDEKGNPQTVRYDAVNAMLLNEFLKAHRKIQELEASNAQQQRNFAQHQKQIEALTAGLQKVSAQLEVNKAAPQTVLNKR